MTIKELALQCEVSEQAIRKWCVRNHVAKDVSQHYIIDETIEKAILQHYGKVERNRVAKHSETSCETNETMKDIVEMLKRELEIKNTQIEELNERLAESQKLLDQQQQLTALQEQKLQLLIEQKADEEAVTEEPKKKHWWQIGKKSADRHK